MSKRSKRKKKRKASGSNQAIAHNAASARPAAAARSTGRPRSARRAKVKTTKRRFSIPWWAYGVGIVVVLGGLLLSGMGGHASPAEAVAIEDPALGPEDALVTLVEYGDLGCPACQAWHQAGVRDQILARYGDRVRFIWRDFPIITPASPRAAEAGRCAQEQGSFFEYQDLVYQSANFGRLGGSDLERYAAQLGLDTEQFGDCLGSGRYAAAVQRNWDQARALHLRGTPAWTVNGQYLARALPDDLINAIDLALAQAGDN